MQIRKLETDMYLLRFKARVSQYVLGNTMGVAYILLNYEHFKYLSLDTLQKRAPPPVKKAMRVLNVLFEDLAAHPPRKKIYSNIYQDNCPITAYSYHRKDGFVYAGFFFDEKLNLWGAYFTRKTWKYLNDKAWNTLIPQSILNKARGQLTDLFQRKVKL